MRYSAKEASLVEEIHSLTKRHQQLLETGNGFTQEAASPLDQLEKRLNEISLLYGSRSMQFCKANIEINGHGQ